VVIQDCKDGRQQRRLECARCSKYIRYLTKEEEWSDGRDDERHDRPAPARQSQQRGEGEICSPANKSLPVLAPTSLDQRSCTSATFDQAAVLLAREAGYLKTKGACRMLGIDATRLLGLRRRIIASVLGVDVLPRLAPGTEAEVAP
jgi:hypothetical protein